MSCVEGRVELREVIAVIRRTELARGGVDLVVDVGDVAGVDDVRKTALQRACQQVEHQEGARVADMDVVVNGRAADVERHAVRVGRDEVFDPSVQGVVEAHGRVDGVRTDMNKCSNRTSFRNRYQAWFSGSGDGMTPKQTGSQRSRFILIRSPPMKSAYLLVPLVVAIAWWRFRSDCGRTALPAGSATEFAATFRDCGPTASIFAAATVFAANAATAARMGAISRVRSATAIRT